jgi:uncharacterized glyoxalase superfamily protein PhnB
MKHVRRKALECGVVMRNRITSNQSAPSATVVPILVYDDVEKAIEWLCGVFGFVERLRVEHDGTVLHAQLMVGDGAIMLGRRGGEYRPPRRGEVSQYVHVTVDDVDGHCEEATRRGAAILAKPSDKPFGERQYTVEDPEGHRWTFSQHVEDVPPSRWGAKARDEK